MRVFIFSFEFRKVHGYGRWLVFVSGIWLCPQVVRSKEYLSVHAVLDRRVVACFYSIESSAHCMTLPHRRHS